MTKASDNAFPSLLITEGTEPSAPAAGKQRVYIDSTTHHLMRTNSSGTETDIEAAAGGLGTWTDYTPTITATTTNPTLGSSTLLGRYKLLDSKTGVLVINMVVTTGGAWNAGSGTWIFSLPSGWTTPNVSSRQQMLTAHVQDSGTTNFVCVAKINPNDTKIYEINVADGTNPKLLTHNTPITWATGDQINIQGIVEIA